MSSGPIVVVEGVTKEFKLGHERSNARAALPGPWGAPSSVDTFKALDNLSFEVKRGDALALIGPNGAGKSTALKIISGAVKPTSGFVKRPVRTVSIIELGLGFNPDLTGIENIDYGGALLGMSPAEIDDRKESIIAFAELEGFETMPIKRYSTGMLARLGFSLATSIEADLFLVDEVLSVGDWSFQKRSLERMQALHKEGAALIFVSHNLWVVNQLCERAVLLNRGELASIGPTPDVLAEYLGTAQYSLEDGGVNELNNSTAESSDDEKPVPDGEEKSFDRSVPRVDTQNSVVTIESLVADPSEIEMGGAVTLTFVIEVKAPIENLSLVSSMFWKGYATFAMPDVHPSEFLRAPGRYEVSIEYSPFLFSASTVSFTIAVLSGDSEEEDPEQLLPGAIAKADTTVKVMGPVTVRPGVFLPHEFSVKELPHN